MSHTKQICGDCNLNECYVDNSVIDLPYVKQCMVERLSNKWSTSFANMNKLDLYKQLKTEFGPEKFLTLNIDRYEKSLLSQFRYGILPLRVETGRFVNEPRCNRICTLCNSGQIEDQIHFTFHCNLYNEQRNILNDKARKVVLNWDSLSEIEKLKLLFNDMTRIFGKYIRNIFLLRRSILYK